MPKSIYPICEYCREMAIQAVMSATGDSYEDASWFFNENPNSMEHVQIHSPITQYCIDEGMINFIHQCVERGIFTSICCEGYASSDDSKWMNPNFAYRTEDDPKMVKWFQDAGFEHPEFISQRVSKSTRYNMSMRQVFISPEVKFKMENATVS